MICELASTMSPWEGCCCELLLLRVEQVGALSVLQSEGEAQLRGDPAIPLLPVLLHGGVPLHGPWSLDVYTYLCD